MVIKHYIRRVITHTMVMIIVIIVLHLIYDVVNARGNTFICAAISSIFLQYHFLLVAFYLFIDNIL